MTALQIIFAIATLLASVTAIVISIVVFKHNSGRESKEEIIARVTKDTEASIKLDETLSTVKDIKYDMSSTRKDVSSLRDEFSDFKLEVSQEIAMLKAENEKTNMKIEMIVKGGNYETA